MSQHSLQMKKSVEKRVEEQHNSPLQSQRQLNPEQIASCLLAQNQFIMADSIDPELLPFAYDIQKEQLLTSNLRENITFNSAKGELGYTNSVLLNNLPDEDIELFLPGYIRMKIRNLIKVDISGQETTVNALIEFSLHYSTLPRLLIDYLKQSIVMRFSKKCSILLKQTQQSQLSIKVIQDDTLSLLTFTIDLPLTFYFQPYYPFQRCNVDMSIWFSPFEKISNLLTITVEEIMIRFDDLMYELGDQYSSEEFDQVQAYFKLLKKSKQDIRKLLIKINLMDLREPFQTSQLASSQSIIPTRPQINSLTKQIREKYSTLSQLYRKLELPNQNSSIQKFRMSKFQLDNKLLIYQLKQQLEMLCKSSPISPNKLTYEEEHLLGPYEIVSSQFNVKFSCYKYLKLMERQEAQERLYDQLMELKEQYKYQKVSANFSSDIVLKKKPQSMPSSPLIELPSPIAESSCFKTKTNPVTPIIPQKTLIDSLIKSVAEQILKRNSGPKTFQFAHFSLSIYKHPFVPLAIVFFPLWIIAFINLIIYFSPRNLSDRIANIATLLISYVAYFPIFRQQIPQYRYLLLAQIFAYLQIVCSFLTLLHSLIYGTNPDENFDWTNVGVIFWISFSITVVTILAVIIAYVLHKVVIQPGYKNEKGIKASNKLSTKALRHIIWNNYECDFQYLKKDHSLIQIQKNQSFQEFLKEYYPNAKLRTQPKHIINCKG